MQKAKSKQEKSMLFCAFPVLFVRFSVCFFQLATLGFLLDCILEMNLSIPVAVRLIAFRDHTQPLFILSPNIPPKLPLATKLERLKSQIRRQKHWSGKN
jgi:hypothetical protein